MSEPTIPDAAIEAGAHAMAESVALDPTELGAFDLARVCLEAAAPFIVPQWRPIETAPDDGTRILMWWRGCSSPSVGAWEVDDGFDDHPDGWVSPSEGFRSDGDQCIPINQEDCTHWMPLPLPPPPLPQEEI